MSKTIEVFAKRRNRSGNANVELYGSKIQLKSNRAFIQGFRSLCYPTWVLKTGIKLSGVKPKHIRITFEEIDDE